MAEELASPAAPAAPTAVSSPLSSQAPSPSASPDPAPAAASPSTPSSPDGTTTVPARPDGLPDSYWDTEKNEIRVDPAALVKDLKERDELKTFKAEQETRRLTLPKDADSYKSELPADFKMPPGSEYKFDAADPNLATLRQIAHEEGWTQAGYSRALGAYAAVKLAEETAIAAGRQAEQQKLGPTAGARVDNVLQWMTGIDPSTDKHLAKAAGIGLVTAAQVEFFETVMQRFSSQGSASFSQQHRVPADDKTIPGFDKMSFEQRRAAQDQRAAQRRSA